MSKLTVSVAAVTLAASLGAYAALPTGAAPFQVVVPNLKSGIEFTLEGLYLQPTNSDLDYATSITSFAGSDSTATNISTVDPDYDFGFRIGLGYIFPDSGNDVQASWTHFSHSTTDSAGFSGLGLDVITRAGREFFGDSDTDNVTASSNADFKYDTVDLDVGQYISVGTRLQTRLFMGLRYAQVKNNLTDTYTGAFTVTGAPGATLVDPAFSDVENYNSKFTGIGPRFGVDATYHVGNCFGVVGHVAAALLVGRVETSTNLSYSASDTPSISSLSVNADNQTRVVPAFDAQLGIDYTWPISNNASSLTIEAGWQVTQYIDAIDRLNTTTDGDSVTRVTSNVGFDGPYLSLNYRM